MIRAQSNVLAQRPVMPRLSRTPAQGAPPNHTQPPHPGCSTGPSLGQPPLQAAFAPTPTGPTHGLQNHLLACPRSWKPVLLLGKWTSVPASLLR